MNITFTLLFPQAGLDTQVIKPSAVMFLAGKVSAVAGDARKALDVCRRAVELCEIQARRQPLIGEWRACTRAEMIFLSLGQGNKFFGGCLFSNIVP